MAAPRIHQPHAVYTARLWGDEWTEQPGVYCDSFSYAAAPDVSEAVLSFNYGKKLEANSGEFVTKGIKEGWGGLFVKVELQQTTEADPEALPRKWIGVIVHITDNRQGLLTASSSPAGVPTGQQKFHCRGLEFVLQRTIVDSSFVKKVGGDEVQVGRAIGFNLGPGRSTDHVRIPNMELEGDRGYPVFAENLETTEEWDVRHIVDYLLAYHPPANIAGEDNLSWSAETEETAAILKALKPTAHVHGKTVKQIFDELIDRRRLCGYFIDYSGDDDSPVLTAFTFNKDSISLPSGEDIPGNFNQSFWLFDTEIEIKSLQIVEDDATRFDVVIARGHPLGSCFTIGFDREETLEKDWDDTLQDLYNEGASLADSYAALNDSEKMDANAEYRSTDKFKKVYKYFRLKPDWDGIIDGDEILPDPTDDTSESHSEWWNPGVKFLDKLPLLTDHDYIVVDEADTTDQTIDNSFPEYLRPFAVIAVEKEDESKRYYYLDRMPRGAINDTTTEGFAATGGYGFSASIQMQDHVPGIIIDISGKPQHAIAIEEFISTADVDADDYPAEADWKDILVTVFAEFDQHVEMRFPEEALTTDTDVVRELVIDVPNARLDYLAPQTVIGIDADGQLIETDGGYVRDDREKLADIARCAYAWYGQTRRALTVVQRNLVTERSIGELLTIVGNITDQIEVNSVVTHLAFDLIAGTVTIQTQYAELDLHGKLT